MNCHHAHTVDLVVEEEQAVASGGTISRPVARHFMGYAMSVEHSIYLPGRFTDADWTHLVEDARDVFEEDGVLTQKGDVREWREGNLRMILEPFRQGNKLTFYAFNDTVPSTVKGGIFMLVLGLLILLSAVDFAATYQTVIPGLMMAVGIGSIARSAIKHPNWMNRYQEQMKILASQASQRHKANLLDQQQKSGLLNLDFEESGQKKEQIPLKSKSSERH